MTVSIRVPRNSTCQDAASLVSPALAAPIQYRYGNLLVEFNGRAFLKSQGRRDS